MICLIDKCENKARARGLCSKHYTRWQRHGDPLTALKDWRPPLERFYDRIAILGPNGCWEWLGPIKGGGYGAFFIRGRSWRAHRWSYQHFIGGVPEGLELDHLCRNKICVNPAHLEAVTRAVNIQRRITKNEQKIHCKRGHPFDDANTAYQVKSDGSVSRQCRACRARHYHELVARNPDGYKKRYNELRRARRARARLQAASGEKL